MARAHMWQPTPAPANPCSAGNRPPHIRPNHAPCFRRCPIQHQHRGVQRQHAHADASSPAICGAQARHSQQQCASSVGAVTRRAHLAAAAAPPLPLPGSRAAVAGNGGACVCGGGWRRRLQPFHGVPEAAAVAAGHAAAAGAPPLPLPPPAHCKSFMRIHGRSHWCWEDNRRRLRGSSSSSSLSTSAAPR
jgi:hypothetical protein